MELVFHVHVLSISISVASLVTLLSSVASGEQCTTPYNTYSAISAMSQPDYQQDPCYIAWKREQDDKLQSLWKRREELEKSIAESNRREYEQRQNMYREREEQSRRNEREREKAKADRQAKNSTSVAVVIGLIVAVCACGCCYACCKSDDNRQKPIPMAASPAGVPAYARAETHPLVPTATVIGLEQEQPSSRPRPSHHQLLPVIPEAISTTDVTIIPAPVENDDPPSYAEALTMPSAPPQEEFPENQRKSRIPGPK